MIVVREFDAAISAQLSPLLTRYDAQLASLPRFGLKSGSEAEEQQTLARCKCGAEFLSWVALGKIITRDSTFLSKGSATIACGDLCGFAVSASQDFDTSAGDVGQVYATKYLKNYIQLE